MPRVFVYEYLTALGIGRDPGDPMHAMYREGKAMRDAVAGDFRAIPDMEVVSVDDVSAEDERYVCCDILFTSHCLMIAPETDGILEQRVGWHLSPDYGVRSLGSTVEAIRLTTDKLALARHWDEHGIPTPDTWLLQRGVGRFPQIWKPRDGCGSTATTFVLSEQDTQRALAELAAEDYHGELIAQPFIPGRPASVAFLIGPAQTVPLLPTFQNLSGDGRFRYEGGLLPIRPDLAERAVKLARKAIDCVPGLLGYVGVDLILGDAADGSEDYAIEINPRLTTSYVGLRELANFNLAEAMLTLADGGTVAPRWKPGRVRFYPDGRVERLSDREEFFE
jgi:hypothetical protein